VVKARARGRRHQGAEGAEAGLEEMGARVVEACVRVVEARARDRRHRGAH
jgi:hypothetical protein